MSIETIILALLVALAGFVQGTVGFGFGIVTMSTIPLMMTPKDAVPMVSLLSLLVSLTLAWKLRESISWEKVLPMVVGTIFGVPIGVTMFIHLEPTFLLFGLGIALLIVCLQQIWLKPTSKNNAKTSKFWGVIAGFASGILGGAFNTGGPPVLLYVGMQSWSKEDTMATLQAFFSFTTIFQIGLFLSNGTIGYSEAVMASKLIIPTIIGITAGFLLFKRINQKLFRTILIIAIGILGCIMLYKSGHKMMFHLSRMKLF